MYGNVCGESEARIFPATLPSFLHPGHPLSTPPPRSSATPGLSLGERLGRASSSFVLAFGSPPSIARESLLVKFASGRCLRGRSRNPREIPARLRRDPRPRRDFHFPFQGLRFSRFLAPPAFCPSNPTSYKVAMALLAFGYCSAIRALAGFAVFFKRCCFCFSCERNEQCTRFLFARVQNDTRQLQATGIMEHTRFHSCDR